MKEVAIIAGASGGIGYEIALLFAQKKIDILIVAKSKRKLEKIKSAIEQQYNITVFCVATDLAKSEGFVDINNCVISNKLSVNYLVNNAGFGDYGFFTERTMEKYSEMLGLKINSLTELTYYYAKQMIKNGKGRIVNVASNAGIQFFKLQVFVYATK
ncbi:MAG: SDR family NAD(P)-dependent oxidoreductase [Flavobacterium sp.]|jgi:short-subunit dehydrogenase|uniref:SDR family NAD(P)-dependent oxidoreductase n=1 Tax=Flavobacterium sp. TaxID=239 RepID=UPI0022C7570D|nr:SDR family NAD(P)-dependent oxidoreductase [Flavobacterium sp.]MCZ8090913.1 SDR family NAD(P)-dependent oxidoreductase [Flavobacterium sp.]MCZ8332227.1 SDR family NAD(P)-dependent oxidoreductase [Flavobacterium sp.]